MRGGFLGFSTALEPDEAIEGIAGKVRMTGAIYAAFFNTSLLVGCFLAIVQFPSLLTSSRFMLLMRGGRLLTTPRLHLSLGGSVFAVVQHK